MGLQHIQQRKSFIGRKPQTDFATPNGATEFVQFVGKDKNFANYGVATADNMDHATGQEEATEQWLTTHDVSRAFDFDVCSEQLGRILYLVFGSVVSTTPDATNAPTVRQHVFSKMSAASSRQLPATSLIEKLGNAIDRLFPSMVAEQLGLRGDGIARVEGSLSLRGSGKYTSPSAITEPAPLAAPGAPTVTPQGAAGAAAYSYYVVARDANGKRTPVSPVGATATGNAVLSGANFNRITWAAVPGAVWYDVLKGNTNTFLATVTATTYDDTGAATGPYTPPAAGVNETGGALNYFYNSQVSLEVDDAGVITNYGTQKRINAWDFGMSNELMAEDGYRPGAALFQTAADPASGALRSELLFGKRIPSMGYDCRLNSESEELAALRAQKLLKPKVELIGPKIGATLFNHKLTIQGEKSPYRAVELGERNGIVGVRLTPNLLFDLVAGKVVTVTLVNDVPSYTV